MPPPIRVFHKGVLPEALNLIRSVFSAHGKPLKIQELYRLAMQQPVKGTVQHILRPDKVTVPEPPHPEHPIRSLSYLKHTILPALIQEKWVEKVHVLREMTTEEKTAQRSSPKSARKAAEQGVVHEWVWQRRHVQIPNPPREKPVIGKEVGVGEDFSHLNKRRQRSRQESIARDLEWVRQLEHARREGARAARHR